jgi:hypothetical protein
VGKKVQKQEEYELMEIFLFNFQNNSLSFPIKSKASRKKNKK